MDKISAQSPPSLSFRIRIRFKILARFRIRVRAKERFGVRLVFRVRIRFLLSIQCRGTGKHLSVSNILLNLI